MSSPSSSKGLDRRAALAAIGAALVGCSSGRTVTVEIRNMKFGPAPSDLKVGDAIHWLNADIFEHTATARDGSFDLDLKPGAEGRTTFAKAGPMEIYCRFHPGMKLTLNIAA